MTKVLSKVKEGRNIRQKDKKKMTDLMGHILLRNCHLKHNTEEKIEGRLEETGRRRRRRRPKQLIDDLKKREYCKLLGENLDRTLWRTRFGKKYGPLVRQTTELLNE